MSRNVLEVYSERRVIPLREALKKVLEDLLEATSKIPEEDLEVFVETEEDFMFGKRVFLQDCDDSLEIRLGDGPSERVFPIIKSEHYDEDVNRLRHVVTGLHPKFAFNSWECFRYFEINLTQSRFRVELCFDSSEKRLEVCNVVPEFVSVSGLKNFKELNADYDAECSEDKIYISLELPIARLI